MTIRIIKISIMKITAELCYQNYCWIMLDLIINNKF